LVSGGQGLDHRRNPRSEAFITHLTLGNSRDATLALHKLLWQPRARQATHAAKQPNLHIFLVCISTTLWVEGVENVQ